MKRQISIIVLSLTSLTLGSNIMAQNYYTDNEEAKKEAVKKVSSELGKKDVDREALLEKAINLAFENYFKNKKSTAKVHEQWEIDTLENKIKLLNNVIKNKDKEINALSAQNFDKVLNDSIAKYNKLLSQRDAELQKQLAQISTLEASNAELQRENTSQALQITDLEKSKKMVEYIEQMEAKKQNALNSAYISCTRMLGKIGDINEHKEAISDYENLLEILGKQIPAEQARQIASIEAVCRVAAFYQESTQVLAAPYNKAKNDELLKKYRTLASSVSAMDDPQGFQKTELQQMVNALEKEGSVILNFRNGIIAALKELGSIPNAASIAEANEIIDRKIKLYNGSSSNAQKDIYNPLYTHINLTLKALREGIKNKGGNAFTNEKTYETFLNEISNKLGE